MSSPTWAPPPIFLDFSVIFLLFYNLKSAYFLIWKCALDPENVSQHYHQQWETPPRHCQVEYLVFGLFICIYLHILSFQNNPTNKMYILRKRLRHLDQNWQSYVEIFILVKIDMLNILVFKLCICICLHILSCQNNPTNKVYILKKRPCYLDQNWRSYVEIFISAKIND